MVVWNVTSHAQKPHFVFRAKRTSPFKSAGGCQFSRLLAAEVCASAVVMLDTPCSEVVWRILATHSFRQFPLTSPPPPRLRVPSPFNWTLHSQPSSNSSSEGNCFNLTLIPLTWRIWWARNKASRWQMGFNSAFKWLMLINMCDRIFDEHCRVPITLVFLGGKVKVTLVGLRRPRGGVLV